MQSKINQSTKRPMTRSQSGIVPLKKFKANPSTDYPVTKSVSTIVPANSSGFISVSISNNKKLPSQSKLIANPVSTKRQTAIPEQTKSIKRFTFELVPYAKEVHFSQFQVERRIFKEGPGINWDGNPINPAMRAILVHWLWEVVNEYKMKSQTLFLAVSYLDRYLQITSETQRNHLQLVGITCLWIAAKFEEIIVPDVEYFVSITDNTYSVEEVLSTERFILNKLNYDLVCVTVDNFLYRFLEASGVVNSQIAIHAKFVAELTLAYYPLQKKYCPSLIAASIVCLMRSTYNLEPICTPSFLGYTNCTKDQINPCLKDLIYSYRNLVLQPTALVEKHKTSKYKNVATVSIPESVAL